jgi:hypothetical protein
MKTTGLLWEPVTIVGGPATRAILQRGSDTDRPGDQFTVPKLTCRVRPNSLVKTRQVIEIPGEGKYLVGDHSQTAEFVTHHLYRCDRQVRWERSSTGTDVVTGLANGTTLSLVGTPWMFWERVARNTYDLTTRIEMLTYIVGTGEDVQIDDMLDGHQVFRIDRAMGLTILGVKV